MIQRVLIGNINFDAKLSRFKKKLKHTIYGNILFPLFTKICYVGENNKNFFIAYGVPPNKLIKLPHAIDNSRFRDYYNKNLGKIDAVKTELGIKDKFNLLFVGRLHESKRVLDVIKAVETLSSDINLLIVGDGLMRQELEDYIHDKKLSSCKILGFKNQIEIMNYYLVADAVVLPSNYLETWGLVINEAMNFNLPVLLSEKVGCAPDLCNLQNGFIYKMGDIKTLANHIDFMVQNPNIAKRMGEESGALIQQYTYDAIISNLLQSLDK